MHKFDFEFWKPKEKFILRIHMVYGSLLQSEEAEMDVRLY